MAYFIPDNLVAAFKELPRLLRWKKALRIQGGPGVQVDFANTDEGATATISVKAKAVTESIAGVFPVSLTVDGGSAGNKTTQCSFTYTVKDIGETVTLATTVAMTGNGNRIVNAAMTAGEYGLAYRSEGTIKLIWADERIHQINCAA